MIPNACCSEAACREGGAVPQFLICSGQPVCFLLQLGSLLSKLKSVRTGLLSM